MGVTELVNAAPSATGAPTGVVATDDERYNAALTRFGFPEPPTAGRRSGKETA